MTINVNINKEAEQLSSYVVRLRKHFHMYPELGMEEFETSKRIKQELTDMEIPFIQVGETGVIGLVGKGKKVIALRADMDALPITENTEVGYKSKNEGVMHACGHDAHMASLLGAAQILKKYEDQLNCTVKLIFQPSEENCKGAKLICDQGHIDDVEEIFGLHVFGDMPCGTINIQEGPRMAATDIFEIKVKGRGGHAGKPQQCVDATVAGAAIVMNLQTVVSRELDPNASAVLTVGKFVSGTAHNIISGEATIRGTVRTFTHEDGRLIENAIHRIADSTAQAYRAKVQVDYRHSLHPEVMNDKAVTEFALESAKQVFPEKMFVEMEKIFLGEDFSVYQQRISGCFAFVGAGNESLGRAYPNHHDKFNMDEKAVVIATKLYAAFAMAQ
ncbi:M20 metallopeptidase family protein [[Clostridium] polysaccharolyticum]|jgi:amidohydrolase|uniref:Amidohydrolase n=1 Tax=[Clostridium] polysaccharolyticum TaxID=29364 RepID=A0A1H9ZAY2_9FIRM|nr:amidohydrolase [[Clostridium] polysaccharolyticum]SES78491.1 amidohydrolase [[Clostridium] polysaccharolyticum]